MGVVSLTFLGGKIFRLPSLLLRSLVLKAVVLQMDQLEFGTTWSLVLYILIGCEFFRKYLHLF